ncbi:hypothetical protein [Enterobacter kobei]
MSFGESTSEKLLSEKVSLIEQLDQFQLDQVKNSIFKSNNIEIQKFISALELKVQKVLKYIIISPLYGHDVKFESVDEAKEFIASYNGEKTPDNLKFNTFIIHVKYVNDDVINAELSTANAVMVPTY